MPVVEDNRPDPGLPILVTSRNMSPPVVPGPAEWDPAFHGSVHTATLAVSTVLVIFVLVLGTFGNGLVLLSALRCRKLRSNFDLFIYNLAATDFIMCASLSPTFLYLLFSDPPSPREFCGGFLFTCTSCGLLSLLTLVAVAAHRQSRVRGKVRGALSAGRTAGILSAIYVISLGVATGATAHVTLTWDPAHSNCQAVMNSKDIFSHNVVLFFISPVIVVSFVIIVVSYGVIARAVRVQTYLRTKALQPILRATALRNYQPTLASGEKAALDMQRILPDPPGISSKSTGKKSEPMRHCSCCSCTAALEKENKAVTMCLVVILIIALCWTPLVISHVVELFTGESIIVYQVKLCGIALVFLNSALNPYMYAQNSGRMKQRYARFFWDMLRCECRVPEKNKFRTLSPPAVMGPRTARSPVIKPDGATLQFLQPKPKRTSIVKQCASVQKVQGSEVHAIKQTRQSYDNNILFFGNPDLRLAPGHKRRPESRHGRKTYGQTDVMSDVRTLVHKTCCHGHTLDDLSLIDS